MYYLGSSEKFLHDALLISEGKYMSKRKYEETIQELEEKEGKLFTIPEVSDMANVGQETIHSYIRLHDVKVFKIRNYKTQLNQTLLPRNEVLKILALRTPCIKMLKALSAMGYETNCMSDMINKMEEIAKES